LTRRLLLGVCLLVGSPAISWAEPSYDCEAEENRRTPTTIEIVLAKKWKDRAEEIRRALTESVSNLKVRVKFFPFLDPPTNLGIGKCVSAEVARTAIRGAMTYGGGVTRLIRQDIMPHHWVKIGSTDTAELAWNPISAEELARLNDPALSTEQFHELYRRLAMPTERQLPFGMGSEKRSERDSSAIEVVRHEWRPDTVWERIGKTKFVWSATVRNTSAVRQRVFVYYDLLNERGVPLARNVANQFVEAGQTATITSDSYILSADLPRVTGSRAVAKVGFPN
jgi:hypothetical protein